MQPPSRFFINFIKNTLYTNISSIKGFHHRLYTLDKTLSFKYAKILFEVTFYKEINMTEEVKTEEVVTEEAKKPVKKKAKKKKEKELLGYHPHTGEPVYRD